MLKWVGGKKQLLKELDKHIPQNIETWYEPFGGSLCVSIFVLEHRKPKRIVVGDTNPNLAGLYHAVKHNLDDLINEIKTLNSLDYYVLRDQFNDSDNPLSAIKKAAAVIVLNKTCFNGLYRVNRSGKFNVPKGKNKPNWDNIIETVKAFSKSIQSIEFEEITCQKFFEKHIPNMKRGDVVYADPPYYNTFNSYDGTSFTDEHQKDLRTFLVNAHAKGVTSIASNSNFDFTKEIYSSFDVHEVHANRCINSDSSKRKSDTPNEIIAVML